MPNSARWVQVAIALTRIGAVLVPLSTLLAAGELVAQLRAAAVQFLVSVEEFRGHRYLDDVRSVPPTELPALRQVWTVDRLADAAAGDRARRIVDAMTRHGHRRRPDGHHVHLRQQRDAQGGHAFSRQRAGCRAVGPRGALHQRRYPAVPADAVLLGGRLRQRNPVRAAGRRHPGDRGDTAAGDHAAAAGTERVTLFRGWPDQAEALARHAATVGADLSACGRAAWRPCSRPSSGHSPARGPRCSA